jgi:hypothetical protein
MICCIAGMHRSGTSLTAAWLQACGLVIADGPTLPPHPDNPKGYFEDDAFVQLHIRSINRRRRTAYGWKLAPPQSLTFSGVEEGIATGLIAIRQAKYTDWGWKDPRSLLFLPAWKRLIPDLKVLVVWRSAHEVAFSLWSRWRRRRNRRAWVDPWQAFRLWRAHNLRAYEYAAAYPQDTVVLSIKAILQNDQAVLTHLNERFHGALHPVSVQTLYDADLMHGAQTPRWMEGVSQLSGCHTIERRLQSLAGGVGQAAI